MRGEEYVGGRKKTGGSLLLIDGSTANVAPSTNSEGLGGANSWGRKGLGKKCALNMNGCTLLALSNPANIEIIGAAYEDVTALYIV